MRLFLLVVFVVNTWVACLSVSAEDSGRSGSKELSSGPELAHVGWHWYLNQSQPADAPKSPTASTPPVSTPTSPVTFATPSTITSAGNPTALPLQNSFPDSDAQPDDDSYQDQSGVIE